MHRGVEHIGSMQVIAKFGNLQINTKRSHRIRVCKARLLVHSAAKIRVNAAANKISRCLVGLHVLSAFPACEEVISILARVSKVVDLVADTLVAEILRVGEW